MITKLRRYLISGLLVWLPILVTYFILYFLFNFIDKIMLLLPPQYQMKALVGFHIPGAGIVLGLILLIITGMITNNFLGNKIVAKWDKLMQRLPLVRHIYSASRQITHSILSPKNGSFSKVALIEFPRKGLYSIALQTNTTIKDDSISDIVNIFIPTAPNPTSGFMIMTHRSELKYIDISIDEALKMVVSIGVISPSNFDITTYISS